MSEVFANQPLILIFIVIAIGYAVGNISLKGRKLGIAAVLFTGLLFGNIDPTFKVPEIIIMLGLVLFIYSIGLRNGSYFFDSFSSKGIVQIFFVFLMLTLTATITIGLFHLFGFEKATIAGIFAGSTTNTSALAGLLDIIAAEGGNVASTQSAAVTGYSITYPMGILGVLIAIYIVEKILKIDYAAEEKALSEKYNLDENLANITIEVTNPEIIGKEVRDVKRETGLKIVFGRIKRGEEIFLANFDTVFKLGDVMVIVGPKSGVDAAVKVLGKISHQPLALDRVNFDHRQVFVSNKEVAGKNLASLNLSEQFSVIVTRIRRGDIDLLASGDTQLELGDQVSFIAKNTHVSALSDFFGNSYESVSRINLITYGVGISLGLLLGMVTFQLPNNLSFKLGYAGGPLLVALILGYIRRTGNMVWSLPYSASVTLQQLGLIFLLAGIGINSGDAFFSTIFSYEGFLIFSAGSIISIISAAITLIVGYKLMKIPFSFLLGMVANQPAILDIGLNKTGNKLPNIGFAMMLPVAIITKIIYTQIIYLIL